MDDSGEGRWTIEAAIEEAVPANVLSAALFARFRSREEHTFGEKLLSAMRFGFGGHVEHRMAAEAMAAASLDAAQARRHRRRAGAAVRDGDLRRGGRSGQAPADAGALQPRAGWKLSTEGFAVLGIDRNAEDDAAFAQDSRHHARASSPTGPRVRPTRSTAAAWAWLSDRLFYQAGDFEDPATYERLAARLDSARAARAAATRCSTWPSPRDSSATSSSDLAKAGLMQEHRPAASGAW